MLGGAPGPLLMLIFAVQGDSLMIFATSFSFHSVNGLVVQKSAAHTHRAHRNRRTDSFLSMINFRAFPCATSTLLFPRPYGGRRRSSARRADTVRIPSDCLRIPPRPRSRRASESGRCGRCGG